MRIVAALGGNALLRRGAPQDVGEQRHNIEAAVAALAPVARRHELIVTHGNGPQVGLLALQSAALADVPAYPLDVLGAESEGMVGYLLEQGLGNRLPGRPTATLLTRVVVAPDDPAFAHPAKPIGPVYARADAERLARERGWRVAPDGPGWRRVVASPEPRGIVELPAVRALLDAGVLVICAGGGGIPVAQDAHGTMTGVEAVIDKDLAAALLARELGADMLLLLTDVPGIQRHWGTDRAETLPLVDADELAALELPAGSMGPKAQAAVRFARGAGATAVIGALTDAAALVEGRAGTRVRAAAGDQTSSSSLLSRA